MIVSPGSAEAIPASMGSSVGGAKAATLGIRPMHFKAFA
jgi:hypothetical protein